MGNRPTIPAADPRSKADALPASMRVAVLHNPGDVRIEEQPVPEPGAGEVLVRLRASGICGSDLMEWYVRQKAPFVFGHEPAGDVVATGPGVSRLKVGDRVALHHHAPCFRCEECDRGAYVHCPQWRKMALRPGGMAEYAVVDANAVRHDMPVLPDSVSYEAATLVEPAACVVKALNRAGLRPGQRVLVVGLGFTGQLFGFLARRIGAAFVGGVDSVPMRRKVAQQHWADEVFAPGTDGATADDGGVDDRGVDETPAPRSVTAVPPDTAFDLVVVTPGNAGAIKSGIAATRSGGTTLLFAPTPPGEAVPFPVHDMFFREVSVVTSYSAGPADMQTALAYVAAGALPENILITHRFPLEAAAEAYRTARRPDEALKVVVTMED